LAIRLPGIQSTYCCEMSLRVESDREDWQPREWSESAMLWELKVRGEE